MLNYEAIFKPFALPSGAQLKNRILMAPMTTTDGRDNGEVSDDEVAYYRERAGGVGAVITACCYVSADGKGFPGEFGVHADSMIPSLKWLSAAIQEKGSKAILQIFHGGAKCPPELLPDGRPISASPVAVTRKGAVKPREMTDEDIARVIHDFGEATRRAIEAGFDGVELHGAHTFLFQQFISPHYNRRTDRWGGSVEKRLAFPLGVVDEIKKVVSKHAKTPFIVGYRLSPEETENPGITIDDTLLLAEKLADRQLDYIHVSVKGFWQESIRDTQDKTPRAVLLHERLGKRIPIVGVGMLNTPNEVADALVTGVPLIAIGRALIMDPQWMQKVQAGHEKMIRTTLSKKDQTELAISDQMWKYYQSVPGWLPIVD